MKNSFRVLLVILFLNQACFSFSSNSDQQNLGETPPTGAVRPTPTIELTDGAVSLSMKKMDDFLVNPGIGFQDGPAIYGFVGFPTTVSYSDRRRISWNILNPADGVYDWSALDQQLEEAVEQGNQFSFRVYTMIGEDFGGHAIPQWVLDKGALLFANGEPDYSNCVYQEAWATFINELTKRYDGNRDIAFIDISGYGNFNEWSWQDRQTEWDDTWSAGYASGEVSPDLFLTLDGQARRRLADMFIGGEFIGHRCRTIKGEVLQIDYKYPGFQTTQLVMPYAGIRQSAQYVFWRRKDVGIRYDCLGADGEKVYHDLQEVFSIIWKTAPVIFEMCVPERVEPDDADWLLRTAHGSLVHNNDWQYGADVLEDIMRYAGYRFYLKDIDIGYTGRHISLNMTWQNLGYAPNYPKMGQDFKLHYFLINANGELIYKIVSGADISRWLPPDDLSASEPILYPVSESFDVPNEIPAGQYQFALAIINERTEEPILLPLEGKNKFGYYEIAKINVH